MTHNYQQPGSNPSKQSPVRSGLLSADRFSADTQGPVGTNGDGATATMVASNAVPASAPKRSTDSPFELPADGIEKVLSEDSKLQLGGIWGSVEAGQTWLASDGKRFVLSADRPFVIFYQNGKFYGQTATGFVTDIKFYPLEEAGRRCEPMAKLLEAQTQLIMGVIAGGSGIGLALVVGVHVVEFFVNHGADLEKWKAQGEAILEARRILKRDHPVLYEKLFGAVLNQVWGDLKKEIPDAINANVVAFFIGVVVGALLKKASKEAALKPAFVIGTIVKAVLVRFFVSILPGAMKLTGKAHEEMARQIVATLGRHGVQVSKEEAIKILDEIKRNPEQARRAFGILQRAFEEAPAQPH